MPNGLKIISEEDYINADTDTARGWTHRLLNSIYVSTAETAAENNKSHEELKEILDKILHQQEICPGRHYHPVLDKVLIGTMSFVGGFVAFFIALKTKMLAVMGQVQ